MSAGEVKVRAARAARAARTALEGGDDAAIYRAVRELSAATYDPSTGLHRMPWGSLDSENAALSAWTGRWDELREARVAASTRVGAEVWAWGDAWEVVGVGGRQIDASGEAYRVAAVRALVSEEVSS